MKATRCAAAAAVCLVTFAVTQGHAASRRQEAQFLAGCEVLAVASGATPAVRGGAFRWFVRHKGETAADALKMVESYRNRPEEWRRMLENARGCLEDAQPAVARDATPDKR